MPRYGQRHPQPLGPERPQPPQRQREPHLPGLPGKPGHPVRRVLTRDAMRRLIGGDKSGEKGISPSCEAS
ncbi:hypothetical protein GCM10010376_86800 [Streptomyces violaceusniger]